MSNSNAKVTKTKSAKRTHGSSFTHVWGEVHNCHWEIKGRFRKRVVLANVILFRFSFRGNIRWDHPFGNHPLANPRNGSLGDKRAVSKRVVLANVPSFRFSFRGNIRQNHPFGNHPFVNPRNCASLPGLYPCILAGHPCISSTPSGSLSSNRTLTWQTKASTSDECSCCDSSGLVQVSYVFKGPAFYLPKIHAILIALTRNLDDTNTKCHEEWLERAQWQLVAATNHPEIWNLWQFKGEASEPCPNSQDAQECSGRVRKVFPGLRGESPKTVSYVVRNLILGSARWFESEFVLCDRLFWGLQLSLCTFGHSDRLFWRLYQAAESQVSCWWPLGINLLHAFLFVWEPQETLQHVILQGTVQCNVMTCAVPPRKPQIIWLQLLIQCFSGCCVGISYCIAIQSLTGTYFFYTIRNHERAENGAFDLWLDLHFWGTPIFSPEDPKHFFQWRVGSNLGQTSGAPQTQLQRRRIQHPVLAPLKYFVSNGRRSQPVSTAKTERKSGTSAQNNWRRAHHMSNGIFMWKKKCATLVWNTWRTRCTPEKGDRKLPAFLTVPSWNTSKTRYRNNNWFHILVDVSDMFLNVSSVCGAKRIREERTWAIAI